MGKLKKIFSNISDSIRETYKKFPMTIIVVYMLTLIYAFGSDDFLRTFDREYWYAVFIISGVGTLFVETMFTKKWFKIIGGICSVAIALIFRNFMNMELSQSAQDLLARILVTYLGILPLATLYKTIKDSKLEIKEFGLKVISNFGKCSTIYALSNIGVLIVILVFIELILDGNDYDILTKTLILLLGGYYVPSLINALTDMKQEPGKFIKVLVTCVFMPIASFLIIILYMYIIKITATGELLKNSIFFILSLTFSIAIPIVLLLRNYDENKNLKAIASILLYAFMPLIILQIIAMGIRISDYGLTTSRYMGVVLIIFEIVFIGLILYKKSKHLDKSILFVVGLVLICVLSPLNLLDVPIMSQTKRLENILATAETFDKLTDENKDECQEIFAYIRRNGDKSYLEKRVSKEVLEKIDAHIPVTKEPWEINKSSYVYANCEFDGIDISEFSKLYEIDYPYNYNEKIDYKNIEIEDENKNIETKVNLEELVNKLIDADEDSFSTDEVFEENCFIKTENENVSIYLTHINFEYGIYTKDVNSMNLGGYIFVK